MSDSPAVHIPHLPAVKVGGRRLSVTSRPKPHATTTHTEPTDEPEVVTDYPRPAAPQAGAGEEHLHHNNHDEEGPKKDKNLKREYDKLAQRKAENTRPTRDLPTASKGFGGAGRIAQPVGKFEV